jgi:cytochrome c
MPISPAYGFLALIAASLAASPALADAEEGKKVFNKCRACHTVEAGKNRVGPSLHGVVGRKSATVAGFNYSDAMKAKNIVWDEKNLTAYLSDPKGFIPGNKMVFPGLKSEKEIADVIAYIQEESD